MPWRRWPVTLLELGRIASRHDTDVAHAMLQAVACAKARGSRLGFPEE